MNLQLFLCLILCFECYKCLNLNLIVLASYPPDNFEPLDKSYYYKHFETPYKNLEELRVTQSPKSVTSLVKDVLEDIDKKSAQTTNSNLETTTISVMVNGDKNTGRNFTDFDADAGTSTESDADLFTEFTNTASENSKNNQKQKNEENDEVSGSGSDDFEKETESDYNLETNSFLSKATTVYINSELKLKSSSNKDINYHNLQNENDNDFNFSGSGETGTESEIINSDDSSLNEEIFNQISENNYFSFGENSPAFEVKTVPTIKLWLLETTTNREILHQSVNYENDDEDLGFSGSGDIQMININEFHKNNWLFGSSDTSTPSTESEIITYSSNNVDSTTLTLSTEPVNKPSSNKEISQDREKPTKEYDDEDLGFSGSGDIQIINRTEFQKNNWLFGSSNTSTPSTESEITTYSSNNVDSTTLTLSIEPVNKPSSNKEISQDREKPTKEYDDEDLGFSGSGDIQIINRTEFQKNNWLFGSSNTSTPSTESEITTYSSNNVDSTTLTLSIEPVNKPSSNKEINQDREKPTKEYDDEDLGFSGSGDIQIINTTEFQKNDWLFGFSDTSTPSTEPEITTYSSNNVDSTTLTLSTEPVNKPSSNKEISQDREKPTKEYDDEDLGFSGSGDIQIINTTEFQKNDWLFGFSDTSTPSTEPEITTYSSNNVDSTTLTLSIEPVNKPSSNKEINQDREKPTKEYDDEDLGFSGSGDIQIINTTEFQKNDWLFGFSDTSTPSTESEITTYSSNNVDSTTLTLSIEPVNKPSSNKEINQDREKPTKEYDDEDLGFSGSGDIQIINTTEFQKNDWLFGFSDTSTPSTEPEITTYSSNNVDSTTLTLSTEPVNKPSSNKEISQDREKPTKEYDDEDLGFSGSGDIQIINTTEFQKNDWLFGFSDTSTPSTEPEITTYSSNNVDSTTLTLSTEPVNKPSSNKEINQDREKPTKEYDDEDLGFSGSGDIQIINTTEFQKNNWLFGSSDTSTPSTEPEITTYSSNNVDSTTLTLSTEPVNKPSSNKEINQDREKPTKEYDDEDLGFSGSGDIQIINTTEFQKNNWLFGSSNTSTPSTESEITIYSSNNVESTTLTLSTESVNKPSSNKEISQDREKPTKEYDDEDLGFSGSGDIQIINTTEFQKNNWLFGSSDTSTPSTESEITIYSSNNVESTTLTLSTESVNKPSSNKEINPDHEKPRNEYDDEDFYESGSGSSRRLSIPISLESQLTTNTNKEYENVEFYNSGFGDAEFDNKLPTSTFDVHEKRFERKLVDIAKSINEESQIKTNRDFIKYIEADNKTENSDKRPNDNRFVNEADNNLQEEEVFVNLDDYV